MVESLEQRQLLSITFAPKIDYPVGSSPISITAADFNGDGKPDLAVANQVSKTVSVLLNNGNGSFFTRTDYATNYAPQSVTAADFNGDGIPDLALAINNSTTSSFIVVLLNNGDGTFDVGIPYPTPKLSWSVTAADFNGDGMPDLAASSQMYSTVSVLRNLGDGSFAPKKDYATGTGPFYVAAADFNGDGKPDLATTGGGTNGIVSVLLNNGTGIFPTKTDYSTGSSPWSVAAADFNGDGKPDLAVTNNGSKTLSVLLNNGTGNFGAKTDYASNSGFLAVVAADFDGDGKPDLATSSDARTVSVFVNNGTGTFVATTVGGTGTDPMSAVSADFNGDGRPDLAVANFSSNTVSILLNQPPIGISPTVTLNPTNQTVIAGNTATFTAAADGNPTPTVQWQVSTDGGATYSPISGATSTTYGFTATAVQNGYRYEAVFTNTAGSATSTVATLTVNSAPTDLALSMSSVAENQPAGTTVGSLSTTDPDLADTFTYSLVSGTGSTDNASFTIVGNQLRSASSFDYETKNSYSIRVRSTDAGGLWYEKVFTITVTDVNEPRYVGGLVWQDLNGNGIQNDGEPGLAGVVVQLFSTADGVIGNGDDILQATTTSDATGHYQVGGLIGGSNFFLAFQPPGRYSFTQLHAGTDDTLDSDVNPSTACTGLFSLAQGQIRTDQDAGLKTPVLGDLLHTLAKPTPTASDLFGYSVAVAGNIVVVGVPNDDTGATDAGAAYLFDATTGSLLRTLANPSQAAGDGFGCSVAIYGSMVVVGAVLNDTGATDAGAAYTFDAATGSLLQTLANPTPAVHDYFGYSVSVSGSTVVVGSPYADAGATDAGAAYLYDAATGSLLWTLASPTPAAYNYFGTSVAISGSTVVVGSPWNDTGVTDAGAAYLFDVDTGGLLHTLADPVPADYIYFGWSVAVSDGTVVVGAIQDRAGTTFPGAAYVFDAGSGNLLHTLADPAPVAGNYFGQSVAVSGGTVLVGACYDDAGATDAGAAYLFDLGTGSLLRTLNNPTPATSDKFGRSVTISGGTAVVGAPCVDGVVVDSGAAYLYDTGRAPTDLTLSSTTIAENQPAGTAVGSLSTTDPDSCDTFTYSLVSGTGSTDNASFTIVGNQLRSASSFDYETKNSYSIRVRSTDAGGLWCEKVFAITVTDVNEAPVITVIAPASVNEGDLFSTSGSFTDFDSVAWTATVDYGDGSGQQPLALNADKTFSLGHTYDDNGSYTVAIRIGDGTNVGTAQVVAQVANVAPTASLQNNGPVNVGSWIVVSFTNPADPSTADTAAGFHWSGGFAEQGLAASYATAPGEFGPNGAIGIFHSPAGTYTWYCRIFDKDGGYNTYSTTFTVVSPLIALSPASIAENQPAGTVVGNLTTTDSNPNGMHTYTLVPGQGDTDNASFTIAGSQLLTAASFDYETKNSYSIRVRSTDSGGLWCEKVFTVNVVPMQIVFSAKTDYATGGQAGATVTTADFNGDGKPDLAVAHYDSNTVSVLLNNGDGTFAAKNDYATDGGLSGFVTAADLNGDGKPDLVVPNVGGTVSVLLNNGDGTFAAKTDYATDGLSDSVTAADFNGDGKTDLAVTSYGGTVSVLLNNGNGIFAAKTDYATDGGALSVTAADFNGDGKPDLAVANESGTVSVLLNNGDGTFAAKTDYATNGAAWFVTAADFNGDGKPDLAVANDINTVSVLLNNGNGTFATKTDYASGSSPQSVTAADFNGDGKPDLAVANYYDGTVSVLLNNGNGTFAAKADYASGSSPVSITAADFNGDGKPDLAVANYGDGTVSILFNQPQAQTDTTPPSAPTNLTMADDTGSSSTDGITSDTTPTFSWSAATDASGIWKYQYQFDGGAWTDTTGLSVMLSTTEGNHAFAVRAVDLAGNVGDAAAKNIFIDTTAPTVTGLALSHDLGISANDGLTSDGTVSWQPASDAGGIWKYQYQLDGGAWIDVAGLSVLPTAIEGPHNISVRAVDAAGNEGPASAPLAFVLKTTPPAAIGGLTMAGDTGISDSDRITSNASPAFSWTAAADADFWKYQFQLNSGAWTDTANLSATVTTGAGTHTFGVRAVDNAGNAAAATSLTWVTDLTGPTITSLTLANDTGVSSTDWITSDSSPTFSWQAADANGIWKSQYQWDGGGWTDTTDLSVTLSANEGSHAFAVRAVDLAGNTGAAFSKTIVVDATGPLFLGGPAREQAPLTQRTLTFDEPLDPTSVTLADLSLSGPSGPIAGRVASIETSGNNLIVQFTNPLTELGQYQLSLGNRIADLAGNPISPPPQDTFALRTEIVSPTVVSVSPSGWTSQKITRFDIVFSEPLTAGSFTLDALAGILSLTGPAGSIPNSAMTLTAVDAEHYRLDVPDQTAEGSYVLRIGPDILDLAGNSMDAPCQSTLTIDRTPPTVLAIRPTGVINMPADHVDVQFSEAMARASFTKADIALNGPSGTVAVNNLVWLADDICRILFSPRWINGVYSVSIDAAASDLAGNRMLQGASGQFTENLPNDPLFSSQWTLENVGQTGAQVDADADLPGAWNITLGSPDIVIAVLDNGVDTSHPDLHDNIVTGGWNFVDGNPDPTPYAQYDNHGTLVAGVAAAIANSIGVRGAAPNVKILPIKIATKTTLDNDGFASAQNIANAIYYAAGRTRDGLGTWHGADVIVCSWSYSGSPQDIQTITDAMTWAATQGRGGRGVPIFCASGNNAKSDPAVSFPASLASTIPGTIAVGASTDWDLHADYSQYGAALDLLAPSDGGNAGVTTTDRVGEEGQTTGDYYSQFGGTSAAAPLAAGVAALMLSVNSSLTAAQVRQILIESADKIGPQAYVNGRNDYYGYGRLNAAAAVQAALAPQFRVIIATGGNLAVTEGGAATTYSAVLSAAPTADVVVRLLPTAQVAAVNDAHPGSDSLLFTPSNWNVPQEVRVWAADDRTIEPATYLGVVNHVAASNDPNYNGITIADVRVTVADINGPAASVGGCVFSDLNRDGVLNDNEPGLAGATVRLCWAGPDGVLGGGDDQWVATATTSSQGNYSFTNLVAGNYYLQFTLPAGSLPGTSFADPNQGGNVFTLAPGQADTSRDVGVTRPSSLVAGRVWNDINQNGVQDAGEPGLGGVNVSLYYSPNAVVGDGDDRLAKTATTDNDGNYAFMNLNSGLKHYLKFSLPTGSTPFSFSPEHQGTDLAIDSDANPAGRTAMFVPQANQTDISFNAGMIENSPLHFALVSQAGGISQGLATVIDSGGNAYLLGTLTGNATLGSGMGVVELNAASANTPLLAEYSADGTALWAKFVGVPADGASYLTASGGVVRAADGSLYVGGRFHGSVDFNPGGSDGRLTASGVAAYLGKFDSNGHFLWVEILGDGSATTLENIALGADGSLYATGQFQGTADFDPSTGTTELTAANGSAAFVCKFIADGGLSWAESFGGSGTDNIAPHAIAVDGTGMVYLTGAFQGTATFGPGAVCVSRGDSDAFVLKLASSGELLWAESFGGTGKDFGQSLALFGTDGVYVGGQFTGTVDFDPGAGSTTMTASGTQPFLLKLDAAGGMAWAQKPSGDRVFVDALGNVYAVGSGASKYDAAGLLMAAVDLAGASGSSGAVANDGTIYLTGSFTGACDFDPGSGKTLLTADGPGNLFLLKLTQASVAGCAWDDVNRNGRQDPGEAHLAGVQVDLYYSANNLVGDIDDVLQATTQTDAYGRFFFGAAVPGRQYYLAFQRLGFACTTANIGDATLDSDVDSLGHTGLFTLDANRPTIDLDAGMYGTVLGGFVWSDTNGNGLQDPGESGIAATRVDLCSALNQSVVATATTAADGHYLFQDVAAAAGDYYVKFTPTSGFRLTTAKQGADDSLDSDADQLTGRTAVFTLAPGMNDLRWDAGLFTETPPVGWVSSTGSTGDDEARGLAVDGSGNLITVGNFHGTINVNPGHSGGTLTSQGGSDIYITKFSSSGSRLLWAKSFGSTGDDQVTSVAVDADGSVFMIGTFTGTIDFAPDNPDAGQLTSQGQGDVFVVKLDRNGQFLWAQGFGGEAADEGLSIAVDSTGRAYVTGGFQGQMEIGQAPRNAVLTSQGESDIFLACFESSGSLAWARSLGGGGNDEGRGIAISGYHLYLTGSFHDAVAFDPGNPNFDRNSAGASDIFLAQFDIYGALNWVHALGAANDDMGTSLTADSAGNVYVTGYFRGQVNFDPGPGSRVLNSDGSSEDIFVAKYASDGSLDWAERIGGSGNDRANAITLDSRDGLYLTGSFEGTVDFDPSDVVHSYQSRGGSDMFTLKLNVDGKYHYVRTVGGEKTASNAPGIAAGLAVAVDTSGRLYSGGVFSSTEIIVDADNPQQTIQNSSGNNSDGTDPIVISEPPPASISNWVWYDSNGNGLQDRGEQGVDGVKVELYSASGALIDHCLTEDGGQYLFPNVDPGSYFLKFSNLPSGFTFTKTCTGSDPAVDSDARSDGTTAVFPMASMTTFDDTQDCGLVRTTVNQPPVIAMTTVAMAAQYQGIPTSGNVVGLANISDPDSDPLAITKSADVAHGSLQIGSTGVFTYTPSPDFFGSDSFSYQVSDGMDGHTQTGTLTFTVKQVTPNMVIGGQGSNSTRLVCSPGDQGKRQVFFNNSSATPNREFAVADPYTKWQVIGGPGVDTLTVDFSQGNPLLSDGLQYDGGGGSSDALVVRDTSSADQVTVTPTQVCLAGSPPIDYSNVRNFGFDLGGGSNLLLRETSIYLNKDNAISSGTSMTLPSGSTLDLNGHSDTVHAVLLQGGTVRNGKLQAGSYTLQTGTMDADLSGPMRLVKDSPGTLVLGGRNSYTGGTLVTQGTLLVTSAKALPSGGALTVGAGATLIFDPSSITPKAIIATASNWTDAGLTLLRTNDGMLHLYDSGTTTDAVPPQLVSDVDRVGITARDQLADTLTLDFSGGNPIPPGGLTWDGGLGSSADALAIKDHVVSDAFTLSGTDLSLNGLPLVHCTNINAFSFDLGAGSLDLAGTTQTMNGVTLVSGRLIHGTLSSDSFVVQAGSIGASLTGSGSLRKTGSGTVTLSSANHYTGGTKVLAGTLIVTSATSLPDGGALTVGAGATLVFDPSLSQAPIVPSSISLPDSVASIAANAELVFAPVTITQVSTPCEATAIAESAIAAAELSPPSPNGQSQVTADSASSSPDADLGVGNMPPGNDSTANSRLAIHDLALQSVNAGSFSLDKSQLAALIDFLAREQQPSSRDLAKPAIDDLLLSYGQ